MNTNRDVVTGSNLGMSSGSEVESAAYHTPAGSPSIHSPVDEVTIVMPERSGIRSKIDDVKTLASEKLDHLRTKSYDVKRSVSNRTELVKSNVRDSVMTAKSTAQQRTAESLTKVQTSMQTSPMKWAGIAAGSGLAIGLLGRLLDARRHQHRHMPQLIVIEI
jgi:ElaB/YqjD/DUF883 family membrane-anchored ribosome-binding protein